jgi:hypothetical protein
VEVLCAQTSMYVISTEVKSGSTTDPLSNSHYLSKFNVSNGTPSRQSYIDFGYIPPYRNSPYDVGGLAYGDGTLGNQ